ncbi:MAG: hypothetical protein ACOX9E_14300, partial [Lentisphaeria bacterium]
SAPIGEKTGGVTRHRRTAAMRDMPPIICANLRNLRIKNVCYQSATAYPDAPAFSNQAVPI